MKKYYYKNGILYEYSQEFHGYIECWNEYIDDTKDKAIQAYEKCLDEESEEG